MPEIRRFIVTQTREVKVTANSLSEAIQLADAAFEHGQNQDGSIKIGKGPFGIWGNTDALIHIVDIHAIDLKPREGH